MMTSASNDDPRAGRSSIIVEVAIIFVMMWIHAGWLAPDVNEPNYLGKAKHFWQPDWCQGDFFLQTADAHHVFYWTFGWLTTFLPLSIVAWIGRGVTYALMAVAWQRLSWAVVPKRLFAVLSAMLLLSFNGRLHMAGEWFVGGFEAKGISYAFVWFGLASLVQGKWRSVWPLLGIAAAWHIVVGIWAIMAAGLAWWTTPDKDSRPSLPAMMPSLFVGFLLASPAWIGMLLLNPGVSGEVVAQAAEIQVFKRIPHHIDPAKFIAPQANFPFISPFAWRHLALIVFWAVLSFGRDADISIRRLRMFVVGVVVIAAMGLVIRIACCEWLFDNPRFAAQLLRLYWFRMTDSIVPVGAALAAISCVSHTRVDRPQVAKAMTGVLLVIGVAHLGGQAARWLAFPYPLSETKIIRSDDSQQTAQKYRDWRALCEQVRLEALPDALFLTPPHNQTFKWYADRGEVVTWKEMPQDAESLLQWWDRYQDVYRRDSGRTVSLAYRDAAFLRELGKKYNADYVVTRAEPIVVGLDVWYQNDSFVVYELNTPD